MNAKELSAAVMGGMDFDILMKHLEPLIERYARRHVSGFDVEDLRQEVLIVIWRCQSTYEDTRGSFLNLVIRSIENKMGHLRARSVRREIVVAIRCRGCGVEISRRVRGPLCACGSTRWNAVRGGSPQSLDVDVSGDEGNALMLRDVVGEDDPGFAQVEDIDEVHRMLEQAGSAVEALALRVLDDGPRLTKAEKKVLTGSFSR